MSKRAAFELKSGPDPCPSMCVELGPNGDGVGQWIPHEKHTLLAKIIGGTRGARAKFPRRVFLDLFCGPGRIQVAGESSTRDGGAVVAWRQSVADGAPFTQVMVGDLDALRAEACRARLAALGAPVQAFSGPAMKTVHEMVASVPRGALVLVYLDPYNLEFLSFEIIKALAKVPKVDLLVHFSIMDLQRNVDMELERGRFNEAAPGWQDALAPTLSKAQLPGAFFKYWCAQIGALGFKFSKEMPLVRGDSREPLYRLVFFSRSDFPNKIWDDIAKSPNRSLF